MESPEPDRTAGPRTEDRARYTSLTDYLRVVRRRRVLIAAIIVAFGVAASAYSETQGTRYEAESQLSFGDPFQDLVVVTGRTATPAESPTVRAANATELVTSPPVQRAAAKRLNGLPTGCSIDASVLVDTGNVAVEATCPSAADAALVANAYASAARSIGNARDRAEIARFADAIADRITATRKRPASDVRDAALAALEADHARLQTLRQAASPVDIVAPATRPQAPVSPRPIRDTGIGLAVGLVVGLLVAFGRDALDRRLRTADEVREELGLPVLGRVSRTALGYAGLARNGLPPLSDAEFEAFRVLRTNLGYLAEGRPIKSVLVTSGLPQEGKSTVSAALASAAVLAGQRALLVECDLRRPSFTPRLGVREEPGMTDYLLGRASPEDIIQTVELAEPVRRNGSGADEVAGTLACIAGGSHASDPAELLVSARFGDLLENVSAGYDLVVLDGGPLLAVADSLEIVPHVDAVILCVRVQQTTREEARAARAALAVLPDRPVGAVLTGMRPGDPDAGDYYGL
jgi:capsular exopolysaccharide synthesis family protein